MTVEPKHPFVIAGQGGGGKRGRGGGGGSEAPNSLHSKQTARLIDLLSEGPIVGPVDGAKSVYFDGVPVLADDGTANFENWSIAGNAGWPDQPLLPGFASSQSETVVSLQVKKDLPITRSISDPDTDRARVTVSVPALQVQDSSGNIKGSNVVFNVYLQSNGGGYALVTQHTISGKTNTTYQRSLTFSLVGDPPWDIRLERVTADSTTMNVQNDLYWDTYTAIIDDRVNYTLSAVIGVTIDAEQFQSIPKRAYDIKGLIIQVPSNYDPELRTYTGVWNGTFKMAWTNNPAWVFYDLVVQSRYGLGNFVKAADVDKWALYRIAQWCDEEVPDGQGGQEPRFVCNAVISTQQEAFDLLSSIASVFRGWAYWAGGQMVAVADMPADPVATYTNANVIDGTFTYHGADIRSRHNMVAVRWNDPTNLGEPRITLVEDHAGISKYGIQKTELIAIGCTSEGQAVRSGRWLLYSDTYEGEIVDFVTSLEAAWARPGDKAMVADVNIGGERRGGRLKAATITQLTLDAAVNFVAGRAYAVSCVVADGAIETRTVIGTEGAQSVVLVSPPFSAAPLPDTVWVVASSDLEPTLWRIVEAREAEPGRYEMNAVRHFPGKWDYVEANIPLSKPDISNIGGIPGISGLNAKDYLVALSAQSIGVRMLISWQSKAPYFDVAWRPVNGNWIRARVDQTAHDVEVQEGDYEIWVTPINVIGRRGTTSKITYTVAGKSKPPADPYNLRIQVIDKVAMFQWAPATDIDVVIGGSFEMRYSPRTTGVTWTSANKVLPSIPGTATTAELPYRPGTYLLKARDIGGTFSTNAAVVVTSLATDAKQFIRICEQPDWLGTKVNCHIQMPQQWLIITDETLGTATYTFKNSIDMGGVFPVMLTVDMLAFPYFESDVFIDERPGLVDDWQNWDSAIDDGDGLVTIQVRQTNNDPASGTAVWTEWQQFLSGEYVGRGFQFRAWLDAPDGQNVAIEQLCIIADVSAKMEQGADIPWVPIKMRINFTVKFKYVPSISIAIQQGVVGDTFRITNKSTTGFDLELIGSTGAIITAARTFDWIATGY
ncbi:host specificity protein J [Sinorhizobium fredii]|uniref:host specificity protein J n=1 Tax=Rhizobium fredii TaxID=380 RepID=UPI0004B8C170|nr:phage tail protein [Sinorhizobium fredii]